MDAIHVTALKWCRLKSNSSEKATVFSLTSHNPYLT